MERQRKGEMEECKTGEGERKGRRKDKMRERQRKAVRKTEKE